MKKHLYTYLFTLIIVILINFQGKSQYLINQDFESGTTLPVGWTISNSSTPVINWTVSSSSSAYGIGSNSALCNFYNVEYGQLNLITPSILTTIGDSLYFDYAYATYASEIDTLYLLASTDGINYNIITILYGGTAGTMTTASATTSSFIPGNTQWGTFKIQLPAGTVNVMFKGGSAYGNNLYLDNIKIGRPSTNPMLYVSCTSTQTNTNNIPQGATNQVIIGVQIVTSGPQNPLIANRFDFVTTGSTNPATDILNAKIFYTGTSPIFSTAMQFGTTISLPDGSFYFTGNQSLSEGTNYFWLVYSISATATLNNIVDANISTLQIGSSTITPTITNPGAGRSIKNEIIFGAATTNSYFYGPLYRSSASSSFDWSRYAYLFSSQEFQASGIPTGATITKIEWYKASTATITSSSTGNALFNVYMKNSTLNTLTSGTVWSNGSTGIIDGSTNVLSTTFNATNNLPATVGWMPFILSSPFQYNGNGLEIATLWDVSAVSGSPATAAINWNYSTGLSYNASIGIASGTALSNASALQTATYGGTLRPNIRISFIPPPLCVAPANQPTNLGITTYSHKTNLNYSAPIGGANAYLIIYSQDPTFTGIITNGIIYSTGSAIGNGTVGYSGPSNNNVIISGLQPLTHYYLWIYAYNDACLGGPVYNISNPLTGNTTTYEHVSALKAFDAVGYNPTENLVYYTKNSSNDNVIIAWTQGNTVGDLQNNTLYNIGDPVAGGGNILYKGSDSSYIHTIMQNNTLFTYKAWSYNNNNIYSDTSFIAQPYSLPQGFYGSLKWKSTLPGISSGGTVGALFFNEKYYSNQWSGTFCYRYQNNGWNDSPGNIDTVSYIGGTRDLTTDGKYIWGGNASTTLYKFNQNMATINSYTLTNGAFRAIAWDPVANGFWYSAFGGNIYCMDTIGILKDSIVNTLTGKYGLGLDYFSNQETRYLYAWSQPTISGQPYNILQKINLTTKTIERTDSLYFGANVIAGGAEVHKINNELILLLNLQNNSLMAYKIADLSKTVNVKLYLEGFWNSSLQMMNEVQDETASKWGNGITDKLTLEIKEDSFPFTSIFTYSNLDITTIGNVSISNIQGNITGNKYIVVKHRNHIETWSANPISFDGTVINYDFTSSDTKAYGDNQKQVYPGKYAILVGDVNQDGVVDLSDLVEMDSDLTGGTVAYIVYDLNGDGVVDLSDLVTIDENLTNGTVVITP
jgi:hypothetical protein